MNLRKSFKNEICACIQIYNLLKYACCEFLYKEKLGGAIMAKCDVCGKGAHFGNNVSHSHRRSNRIWNSNVKSVKCKVNGATKSLHVCTACLRSGNVERA